MYEEYVRRMRDAKSAAERSRIINDMCNMFAFSRAKAYKILKANGWESGRKKRTDAGTSSMSDKNLYALAALLQHSMRKNGKKTMSVEIAKTVLVQNGFDVPVSNSRLRELLNEKTLSTENTNRASPAQRMRTEYPNQVHFADPSVALLYFAPDGKQHILRDDEVYKNKPFLEGREQLKCWRYVLTDHYSSCICVRYYAAAGETAANMYDFLLYAWGKKKDPLFDFHGLPELLIWDCGSANLSRPVTSALKALRVETKPHMPGNPRAKGQVEKANDIVETQFECLLKLEPVHSIEELNEAAERWCAAYNANMIEGRDTRLVRGGRRRGRNFLWNKINEDEIRELPDAETCRQIFTTGIQTRTVGGDLSIGIVHPKAKRSLRYSLSALPEILVGQEVNVQPVLVDDEMSVIVSYEMQSGQTASYEVKPIEFDDAGFDVSAAVFGKEYKSQPDTLVEKNVKQLTELAKPEQKDGVPFARITNGYGFKAHSLIHAENPFAQTPTGRAVEVATVHTHEILISTAEAAKRVKARTEYLPDGFIAWLKTEYPDGVPASAVDALAYGILGGERNTEKLA